MEWTTDAVERLIVFVEGNKFLYDATMADYHNRTKRRATVDVLAKELGTTCKLICCVINNQQ